MSTLAAFFQGSDTRFGVFSPKNYLLAIFPEFATAAKAERLLRESGLKDDEVIAVTGADLLELVAEERSESGLFPLLMQQVNELLDAEVTYLEHDLKLAREGAAFVFAYAPSEERKVQVWQAISPLDPLIARHYGAMAIDHLKGES